MNKVIGLGIPSRALESTASIAIPLKKLMSVRKVIFVLNLKINIYFIYAGNISALVQALELVRILVTHYLVVACSLVFGR